MSEWSRSGLSRRLRHFKSAPTIRNRAIADASLSMLFHSTAGIRLLSAHVFRSEQAQLPADRFRIGFGFGRTSFDAGLATMEAAL